MHYPPQSDPVCCRCGTYLPENFVPIVEDHQTKAVCQSCATPDEKAAANPKREESQ